MLPPIIRRLFSSSPFLAPLLLVLAITTLFLGAHPRTRPHVVPSSWVGGSGVGGAVGVGKHKDKVYNHDAPVDPAAPVVAAPPQDDDDRLPAAYASYFKNRVLPDSLDAVPALAVRLGAFLRRPILSHEAAWEKNLVHCPLALADQLANMGRVAEVKDFWEKEVTPDEIVKRRAELVKYLAAKVWEGVEVLGKEGTRGIVMTAGNRDTTQRLVTLLKVLNELKVKLPVEVFHYPDELSNAEQRKEITDLGAKLIQVKHVRKSEGAWKNWQIKGYALIQSSFSEILYLDSDNVPLRDPTHLFTAPKYLNSGQAAFWPDLSKDHPANAIWRIVGEQCTLNDWAFESGQMVISKAGNNGLNLAALHIAAAMMDEDNRDFWFRLAEGDKDTFRWAFRILDLPYTAAPRWMSALGFLEADDTFCGHTSLQYDLVTPPGLSAPPPLFVHSNLLKHLGAWGYGGEKSGLFSYIKRMAIDDASDTSLNHANLFVRQGGMRNMCLDLKAENSEVDDKEAAGGDGANRVILEAVDQVEGNPFAGFEEMFAAAGGKTGGWDA